MSTINYHSKEIFKSGELVEKSVIQKIQITANDCKNYNTNFYSLDAIIAVGYRVNSKKRLIKLNEIAISQMEILTRDKVKLLEDKSSAKLNE